MKIPYMLVPGDKEEAEDTVFILKRDSDGTTVMKLQEFVATAVYLYISAPAIYKKIQ